MSPHTSRFLRILGWTVLFLVLPAVVVLFWAPLGLFALGAIVIAAFASVVRSLIQELRGRRPEDSYRPGSVRLSHLPERPARTSHFADRNPGGEDRGASRP